MVAQKFSECFWETEFCGVSGFERLVNRIKSGKSAVKDVESFIKERSKIEHDYSKALSQLAGKDIGRTESGTMREVLAAIKSQVEKSAGIHFDMYQSLAEQASRIGQIREQQSGRCKQAEAAVKQAQNNKKDLLNKTKSSQQIYVKKSQEYDSAHQAFLSEKGTGGANKGPKELAKQEKLDQRAAKCKEDKLKANDTYESLVKLLETARQNWEGEMTRMCDTFQEVENDRITFLRNEIWVHINIDSASKYEIDQGNEEVRAVLTSCDPKRDIQEFIRANQTGNQRPAAVLYESCDQVPTSSMTIGRPKPMRPTTPLASSGAAGGSTFFGGVDKNRTDSFDDPTYASIP